MSFQAQNWAVKIKTGTPSAKAVLLLLANYADHTGFCYPSQERLAEELELTERTVRDALGRLEEMGVIRRERRYTNEGFRTSDGIRLNASYGKPLPSGPKGQAEGFSGRPSIPETISGRADTLPEINADLTGNKPPILPETISEELPVRTTKNHQTTRSARGAKGSTKPNYSADFEALWECVPNENPGSKADAFRAFSKLTKEDQGECLRGWLRYEEWLEEKRKTKADWPIKQLVSFINGRLWESHQKDAA